VGTNAEIALILRSQALLEQLSAIEHERWAHWQQYVHAQCARSTDGSLTIPAELVERWDAQIATPYEQLSDLEKESDREQVRRYLPVLLAALAGGGATD
jgi:hypothetical protein